MSFVDKFVELLIFFFTGKRTGHCGEPKKSSNRNDRVEAKARFSQTPDKVIVRSRQNVPNPKPELPLHQHAQNEGTKRSHKASNAPLLEAPKVQKTHQAPVAEGHFSEVSFRSFGSKLIFAYPKDEANDPEAKAKTRKRDAKMRWVPLGESSIIAGITIPDGGVYVGKANRKGFDYRKVEPSLIDPGLPIARHPSDFDGAGLSYWPSFEEIPEVSRRTYLQWLANGKKDKSYDIGYVFLYFYGLERRLILDAKKSSKSMEELPALQEEVRRLLDVYGENRSFRSYATLLLEFLEVSLAEKKLYELGPKFSKEAKHSIFNQYAIAQLVNDEKFIPADWALAWAYFGDTCQFRTPARRSEGHFRRLFLMKFDKKFPKGFRIKPNKTKLASYYRPANLVLEGRDLPLKNLPNPMVLKRPGKLLQGLVDECNALLEPYSRWLGRNPEQELSLRAFALLPSELLAACAHPLVIGWMNRLQTWFGQQDEAVMEGRSWLGEWPFPNPENIGKRDTVEFISFLGKIGVGVEPDPRFGGKPFSKVDTFLLFKLGEEDQETAGPDFRLAKLDVHLAAVIAWADDCISPEEIQFLFSLIENRPSLTDAEKRRLRAHVGWLILEKPSLTGIKARLKALGIKEKQVLGRQLIAMATADGVVDPKEIKVIEKLYTLLGIDSSLVIKQIHVARTISKSAQLRPRVPTPKTINDQKFLDPEIIATRKQESEKVAQLLGDIFDLEEEEPEIDGSAKIHDLKETEIGLFGLDSEHSRLLIWLGQEECRERVEVENFCAELGLFTDGALETLNELAFELMDEPLLEDGEVVEIIPETYERLFE